MNKYLLIKLSMFCSLVLMNACSNSIKPKKVPIIMDKSVVDIHCMSFGQYFVQPSDEDILQKGGHLVTTKFSVSEILRMRRKVTVGGKIRRCIIKTRNTNDLFYMSQNGKFYDSNYRKILISNKLEKTILSEINKAMNLHMKKVLGSKRQNLVDIVATKISTLNIPKSVCIKNGSVLTDIARKIIKETNIKSIEEINTNLLIDALKKLYPCLGKGDI